MLQRVKVGSVIWKQIVLIECLELHGSIFFIFGGRVALVVEMVGGCRVDHCGLLGLSLAPLAINIDYKCQEAGAKETRYARGYQMDKAETSTFFVFINT